MDFEHSVLVCSCEVTLLLAACPQPSRLYEKRMQREDHRALTAAARALLYAPRLRRLEVHWSWDSRRFRPLACGVERRVALSALRRCRAAVQELVLPQPYVVSACRAGGLAQWWDPLWHLDQSDLDVLVGLVAATKHCLRSLTLGGLLCVSPALRATLPWLPRLQSLRLGLYAVDPAYASGVRALCPPGLLSLEVDGYVDLLRNEAAAALLADLVSGAAGCLRRLDVSRACSPLPLAVVDEVRRCRQLRELCCALPDATLLPALPRLRRLSLWRAPPFSGEDAFVLATALLRDAGPQDQLRELTVVLQDMAAPWPGLELLLRALATAAVEATHLSVLPDRLAVASVLFLERMPWLQSVTVHHCTPAVLGALAGLPELRRLLVHGGLPELDKEGARDALGRLRSLCHLTVRGGRRHCAYRDGLPVLARLPALRWLYGSCAVRTGCHCQYDVVAFKRLRPDVNVKVTHCRARLTRK